MSKRLAPLFVILLLPLPSCLASQEGEKGGWELLGEATVEAGARRVEIQLRSQMLPIQRVKLGVEEEAVTFTGLTVHYRSGNEDFFHLRQTVESGSETRDVVVSQGQTTLRRVVAHCRLANQASEDAATIKLWGR